MIDLPPPYLCSVSAIPLRSRFTIRPIWLPVSSRIAPFWLVSTIACGPRPPVAPPKVKPVGRAPAREPVNAAAKFEVAAARGAADDEAGLDEGDAHDAAV